METEQERLAWIALKTVLDPELGINIVDLGLVYRVRWNEPDLDVEITMTSPVCPLGGLIQQQAFDALVAIPGVRGVSVEVVWEPPWHAGLMSQEARAVLGWEL